MKHPNKKVERKNKIRSWVLINCKDKKDLDKFINYVRSWKKLR